MYKQPVYRYRIMCALGIAVAVSLSGCSLFRGKGTVDSEGPPSGASALEGQQASAESQEERLRKTVEEHVTTESRVTSPEEAPVVKRAPYFLKEYSEYPKSVSDMQVSIRETESRMAPEVADVTLSKQRYVTEMHRKKDDAREDSNFYRETGKETLTYQWRNNRWVQVASLFVVELKEERTGGEWQAVEPKLKEETVLPEEDEGIFKRVFGSIFGR